MRKACKVEQQARLVHATNSPAIQPAASFGLGFVDQAGHGSTSYLVSTLASNRARTAILLSQSTRPGLCFQHQVGVLPQYRWRFRIACRLSTACIDRQRQNDQRFVRTDVLLDNREEAIAAIDPWLRQEGSLEGRRVLCLAAGGGTHGPLFALAGADVTVVDFSK